MQVLIVDDSDADQFLNQYLLESYDPSINVLQAYDGEEALSMIGSGSTPDYIFLDINMPRMGGIEFLENYSTIKNTDDCSIIMLTSSIREDDYDRCITYPQVKKCLAKPLSIDDLPGCFN